MNGGGGGGSGNPERGNRIDNRARGNASQLHEKYRTLARDAQTQGDRVMAEYYLQFADHYFRVLSESRNRFDEQRRARGDFSEDDGDMDGDAGMDGMDARDQRFDDQPYEQQPRYEQRDRQPQSQPQPQPQQRDRPRDDRPRDGQQRDGQQRDDQQRETGRNGQGGGQGYTGQGGNGQQGNGAGHDGQGGNRDARAEHEPRRERVEPRPAAVQASEAAPVADGAEAPRRPRGRPRRVVEDAAAAPRLDGLPPAFLSEGIGTTRAAEANGAAPEGEERPRRRLRRPRADEGAPVEV